MTDSVLVEQPGVGLVLKRVSPGARLAARLRFASLDEALAEGAAPESGRALALRAQRLLSLRMRRRLARSLRRSLEAARRPAVPPRLVGGRHLLRAADELLALAELLERPGPVDVRGVARVCVLLTDGAGPLHRNQGAARLIAAVHDAGDALAPRSPAAA